MNRVRAVPRDVLYRMYFLSSRTVVVIIIIIIIIIIIVIIVVVVVSFDFLGVAGT